MGNSFSGQSGRGGAIVGEAYNAPNEQQNWAAANNINVLNSSRELYNSPFIQNKIIETQSGSSAGQQFRLQYFVRVHLKRS
jgi:hypothetical protein